MFTNETKGLHEQNIAYGELFALGERFLAVADGDHMAATLHQTMRDRAPDAYTGVGCVYASTVRTIGSDSGREHSESETEWRVRGRLRNRMGLGSPRPAPVTIANLPWNGLLVSAINGLQERL